MFLKSIFNTLFSLHNKIDFTLRQTVHWSRPGLRLANQSKQNLFENLPDANRQDARKVAWDLFQKYQLESIYNLSSQDNYCENLFYLELLQRAFSQSQIVLPDPVQVVDIGPSSWFYVRALYQFLRLWNAPTERTVDLVGYEEDPFRVYANWHSRYDHAVAYTANLAGVTYIPGPFPAITKSWDVALLFFPFVFLKDHLEWGLPQDFHNPQKLLEQAWESVRPGGVLLIVNQGPQEAEAQQKMLAAANISVLETFKFESTVYHYALPRYVHVAVR